MTADPEAVSAEIIRHHGEIMRVRKIIQQLAALTEEEFVMTVVEDPSVIYELWDITDKSSGKFLVDFLGFQPEARSHD